MIRTTRHQSRSSLPFYAASLVILLLYIGTRWFDLLHMPIFIDEATGLSRTRDSLIGFPFQGLAHAKWLPTFIWALFRPFGPESLWITRGVNALLSTLTCASAVTLGRFLHSRKAGLLAGLLVLTLPYTIFFERQALADTMLMAFSAAALVASIRLARSRNPILIPITGLLVAATILSKFTGFTFAAAPVLAALLLADRDQRRPALIRAALSLAVAALILLVVFVIADRYLRDYQSILDPTYTWGWLIRHSDTSVGPASLSQRLDNTVGRIRDIFGYFVGLPIVALTLSSIFVFIKTRDRRLIWLWLAAILTIVPMLAAANALPARYVAYTIMPFTVLAAVTTWHLLSWLRSTPLPSPASSTLTVLIIVGLLISPLPRSLNLWLRPEVEPIPDYGGYQTSVFPLQGLNGVRDALTVYAEQHGLPVHLVYEDVTYLNLSAYWGGHTGLLRQWEDTPDQQVEVANWLIAGDAVVYLDVVDSSDSIGDEPHGTIGDEPHGNHTELLGTFPAPDDAQFRLRAVTEPGPAMLRTMLNQVYGNPDALAPDYEALASTLHERQLVMLHPGHQIDILREKTAGTDLTLIPLAEDWPPDFEHAADLIPEGSPPSRLARAVFFNETAGDPDRRIEGLLNQRYYRIGEQWFGAVRSVEYVTFADDFQRVEQAPTFGDLIQLESAQVGSVNIDGRRLILVDLLWTALEPVGPSYTVALHIIDPNGEIVAQHDSIPAGDLAPTSTWTPGDTVIDRFAIDAPPGTWSLRLILYDAESGARLPVENADSLILAEVTVPD